MYSNFISQSQINSERDEVRKARENVLKQAKKRYERDEAKKRKAQEEGQDTWMLDSVSERIKKEEEDISKVKKKKKKEKKKKKKSDKKKHRHSSGSSSSSDNEQAASVWVEAQPTSSKGPGDSTKSAPPVKGPQLQRESWMDAPLDLLPTTCRQDQRNAQRKQKDEVKKELEKSTQPGQHVRELNPHWKNGGTGLPEEEPAKSSTSSMTSAASGDGGLWWLRKTYENCKTQAAEEGRSLAEVVAERWGPLQKLESQIQEAERKLSESRRFQPGSHDRGGSRKGDSYNRRDARDADNRSSRNYSDGRKHRDYEDRDYKVGKNETSNRLKTTSGGKSSSFQRPDSGSEDECQSSRSSSRFSTNNKEETERSSGRSRGSDSSHRSGSKHFISHSEESFTTAERDQKFNSSEQRGATLPRWKKQTTSDTKKTEGQSEPMNRKSPDRKKPDKKPVSSSSGDTDTSVSDSEAQDSDTDKSREAQTSSAARVLSEDELNELAAKILRAEIMGDDATAASLKVVLENARKLKEEQKMQTQSSAPDFAHNRRRDRRVEMPGRNNQEEEGDNVVVLSRTGKGGLVRPVLDSAVDKKPSGGKNRKKNVGTHNSWGERTIYFDDDDKLGLKDLVEQEKAGTAEDQNAMFARLASRANDRDLDVDDMFVSKAAMKQNEERTANKDRVAAIIEHKKLSSAMGKCHRCLEKVFKHLIVAMGTKSYLCLPHHSSLTTSHCLIVPMQHVSAATSMDEDVWLEIQLFRKSLVQMFSAQGQDVVIMETVMHLKHFPHTAIECVPLDRELGDLAPIYFKKAIQDAGPEWSDNKKLYSLSNKDIRHVIPKGFPYFSVDFGLQGGYATVIEDEKKFPSYFGREMLGGMLDAEPGMWRKPHNQSFEDQRQKVLQFAQLWKPFDWTQSLKGGT